MTWGPWIEHDGTPCPVPGRYVLVEGRRGGTEEGVAVADGYAWEWRHDGWIAQMKDGTLFRIEAIVRYRVRLPKGMEVLDAILKDLDAPVPVRQPEDA